ncbi:E3 ubiquitin ligase [Babesia ovis]|uniref:RING-type E3 ubiquitin transferase n=1 Tax=Babesia ovis TaxID=5869 RepID=A0A9W5WVD2_BABOV|nr:E3 ubiquitin ligase [Babesia ovis]
MMETREQYWERYVLLSHLLLACSMGYVGLNASGFYDLVVFFMSNNGCVAALCNYIFMLFLFICYVIVRIFLGTLSQIEFEQLVDMARNYIMDAILFLILSKPRLNGQELPLINLVKYLCLLVALKSFHVLVYVRQSNLFQMDIPSFFTLMRYTTFLYILSMLDSYLLNTFWREFTWKDTFTIWMMFEVFAMSMVCLFTSMRLMINMLDFAYDSGLKNKTTILFYLELAHDLMSLISFSVFMVIFYVHNPNHIPAYMLIDIIHVVKNLVDRVQMLMNYRKMVRSIETRYAKPTEAEMERDGTCIICRDDFDEDCRKIDCGHIFHLTCLKSWLFQHSTCPTCRAPIENQEPRSTTEYSATQLLLDVERRIRRSWRRIWRGAYNMARRLFVRKRKRMEPNVSNDQMVSRSTDWCTSMEDTMEQKHVVYEFWLKRLETSGGNDDIDNNCEGDDLDNSKVGDKDTNRNDGDKDNSKGGYMDTTKRRGDIIANFADGKCPYCTTEDNNDLSGKNDSSMKEVLPIDLESHGSLPMSPKLNPVESIHSELTDDTPLSPALIRGCSQLSAENILNSIESGNTPMNAGLDNETQKPKRRRSFLKTWFKKRFSRSSFDSNDSRDSAQSGSSETSSCVADRSKRLRKLFSAGFEFKRRGSGTKCASQENNSQTILGEQPDICRNIGDPKDEITVDNPLGSRDVIASADSLTERVEVIETTDNVDINENESANRKQDKSVITDETQATESPNIVYKLELPIWVGDDVGEENSPNLHARAGMIKLMRKLRFLRNKLEKILADRRAAESEDTEPTTNVTTTTERQGESSSSVVPDQNDIGLILDETGSGLIPDETSSAVIQDDAVNAVLPNGSQESNGPPELHISNDRNILQQTIFSRLMTGWSELTRRFTTDNANEDPVEREESLIETNDETVLNTAGSINDTVVAEGETVTKADDTVVYNKVEDTEDNTTDTQSPEERLAMIRRIRLAKLAGENYDESESKKDVKDYVPPRCAICHPLQSEPSISLDDETAGKPQNTDVNNDESQAETLNATTTQSSDSANTVADPAWVEHLYPTFPPAANTDETSPTTNDNTMPNDSVQFGGVINLWSLVGNDGNAQYRPRRNRSHSAAHIEAVNKLIQELQNLDELNFDLLLPTNREWDDQFLSILTENRIPEYKREFFLSYCKMMRLWYLCSMAIGIHDPLNGSTFDTAELRMDNAGNETFRNLLKKIYASVSGHRVSSTMLKELHEKFMKRSVNYQECVIRLGNSGIPVDLVDAMVINVSLMDAIVSSEIMKLK